MTCWPKYSNIVHNLYFKQQLKILNTFQPIIEKLVKHSDIVNAMQFNFVYFNQIKIKPSFKCYNFEGRQFVKVIYKFALSNRQTDIKI